MSEVHVFHASGDACPICAALDGQIVESPGYTPHDGCLCQTKPQESQGNCEWSVEHKGNARDGDGWADVIMGFEVTVVCPDGSSFGSSGQFDAHAYSSQDIFEADEAFNQDLGDAVEELAKELCDQCPPEKPFLCC